MAEVYYHCRIAVADEWIRNPIGRLIGYGLFAVMTTERHEIIVQGSNDGVHWLRL